TVIIIDSVTSRLEQAKKFGADFTIDMNEYPSVEERKKRVLELTNGYGADVGLEVAGVPAAFAEGIELIRTGGSYVTIGNVSPGKYTDFDPGLLTRKSIKIFPVVRYNPWYLRKALEFLSRSEEHTSELQSRENLVCRLLLEKKKKTKKNNRNRKTRQKK